MANTEQTLFAQRFRGFFPVVIDVETAGFNKETDALLEIAASVLKMDDEGLLSIDHTVHFHVQPFEGANIEQAAIEFNGIEPFSALRGAVPEEEAIKEICKVVRKAQKAAGCQRSVVVAHNAAFDHGFLNAAIERNNIKRTPFHPFVSFDTTSLAGLALGQTVLAKACRAAGIEFDNKQAHSALYDTERTAELYCLIVNRWQQLGGWPLAIDETQQSEDEASNQD
ncbi:ribonuclease T [Pseudoalteromonas sp. S1610]|jgi:ribonuclease T|uniref:ribonuclease T n=1 Tax=unclassified Pseudoalteromonas TaxID=194690 RepID=UPI00040E8052|nr:MULTISPECIES: ribonuclease T [unclassified Pseudoalteromonas]MCK8128063.1 ribonuclease T [Pseudoalteromonas sp. 2CM39R]MDN3487160.1 ribonuclease T [Pseudoalteromonas sp. APC 3224]TMP57927.1 ribonuclease T [Pseudoalteromonas sp. S1612]TMP61975.1 ribonuclease T [Pseudoalteromonas sp. S1610]TMP69259.1 ribonuclease T [Pseudoalteromonas sp. S1609]